jgi:dTDP-glucose pyrophosphorylase
MKAVILAAGKGTRLSPYSEITPKPLMPIELSQDGGFRPILDRLIDQIRQAGVREIVVVVNYKADLIMGHLDDGHTLGVKVSYVWQGTLDGNAGAYYRAQHLVVGDDVIVTDSDNFLGDDDVFLRMAELHRSSGASVTVGVSRVPNPSKFAIIKVDAAGNPVDIYEKPTDVQAWGNLAKSGLMILSRDLAAQPRDISLTASKEYTTTQIIKHCLVTGRKVALHDIAAGFHDIGTWEEYLPVLRERIAPRPPTT